MKTTILALLILSLCSYADTIMERIENDLSLTADQKALYLVYSVFDQSKLPLAYTVNTDPVRSGSPALHEALLMQDELSQATLNQVLGRGRPALSGSPQNFVSPDGHFRIHYTTSGTDASSLTYANDIAEYVDYSWQTECVTMGYFTPPPDNGLGGDDLYDIYIMNAGPGTCGYCSSGGEYKPADSTHASSASHIVISNTQGTGLNQVTAAHEFQHAIQNAYDWQEPTWFMENCAVWMEDMVYDDVNDWTGYYGGGAMRKPWMGIDGGNPYWYGGMFWPRMMGLMFEENAVRKVWEYCAAGAGPNMFEAQDDMFESYGSSFENAFMEYGVWRFFVGSFYHANFNLFDDELASVSNAIILPWNIVSSLPYSGDYGPGYPAYHMETLGITWIKVDLSAYQGGWVEFDFDGRDNFDWNLGAIIFNDDGFEFNWYACDPTSGEKTVAVPTEGYDFAIFFPAFMAETSFTAEFEYDITYSTGIEEGETLTSTNLNVESNPMEIGSAISFNIPSQGHADLSIIDMTGRRVSTLFTGQADAGLHSFEYNGELTTGTYFVVLRHENSVETARVAVLR